MTAEERKAKQIENKLNKESKKESEKLSKKTNEEENRRRNDEREAPVTPRAKAKNKTGPSPKKSPPKKPSPKKLEPVPPFPDGGEQASGSTDNPEPEHVPKERRGRPPNTQPTNQGPTKVRKDISKETPTPTPKAKTKTKGRAKANPNHDTERIDNPDPEFWKNVTVTMSRKQLNKRGFRRHSKIDGTSMRKANYFEEMLNPS